MFVFIYCENKRIQRTAVNMEISTHFYDHIAKADMAMDAMSFLQFAY